MDDQREAMCAAIRHMLEVTGLSATELARKAKISASTLTRFLNSDAVKHQISLRTLSRLVEVTGVPAHVGATVVPFRGLHDKRWQAQLGARMRLVRDVMAQGVSDEDVAYTIGWVPQEMEAIFYGQNPPSVAHLAEFAKRMRVTSDFLLYGKLDGLSRRSERLILEAHPEILDQADQEGTQPGMGTGQSADQKARDR